MAEQQDLESKFQKYVQGNGLTIKPIFRGSLIICCTDLRFTYEDDGRSFYRSMQTIQIRHPSGRMEQIEEIKATLPFRLRKVATVRGVDERGDKYTREVPFKDIKEFYLPKEK